MDSCSNFGKKLRYLRRNKGLSQRRLAEIIGVTDRIISDYERNKHMPSGDKLNRIAKEFGVTAEQLLDDGYYIINVTDDTLQENGTTYPLDNKTTTGDRGSLTKGNIFTNGASISSDEYLSFNMTDDTMEPRIYEGDTLIIKKQSFVDDNQIALVSVSGKKAIIRKVSKATSGGILLISLNNKYNPQFISKKDIERLPVIIMGRVVELRSQL